MPVGAQIFDASGNVIQDYTDSTGKYLGQISIPASGGTAQSGTVSNSAFSSGTLWWVTTLPPTASYASDVGVSLSGTTLSWAANSGCPACILYYGIV